MQWVGKANKNGVQVENRPIRRVQPINLPNHMTQANHQLEKQLLNPHAIFARLSSPLDMARVCRTTESYIQIEGILPFLGG